MSTRLHLSLSDRESAKASAADRQLGLAKRRAYLNALARQTFLAWARETGLTVTLEGAHSADPDLVELLDVSDVMVGDRRVNVAGVYPPAGLRVQADRRALVCGYHADVYVFVQIAQDLRSATIAGVAPLEAFVDRSWLDPSGAYLILDPSELQGIDQLGTLLAQNRAEPDASWPLDHAEVFDRIAAHEDGQIPPEERGSFERHLYGCAECRRQLIALRFFRDATVGARQPVPGSIIEFGPRVRKALPRQGVRALAGRLAAADEGFILERPGAEPVPLFVPDEAETPRLTEFGIAGTLILPDRSFADRPMTVDLALDFDGLEPESFAVVVQGEVISLEHPLGPEGVGRWLRDNLAGGGTITLSRDHLCLRASTP